MNSREIRLQFLEFMKAKGHVIVPSSSLVSDDPSVLLTTAGMQQFKRYYTGELDALRDFGARRTASIQKSFRTSDIEEVGDETHLTFFEMLGNFSFGDYFKEEAILWAYEFMTERLAVSPDRISVSIFKGDSRVPRDKDSFDIWHSVLGIPKERINERGMEDNFWGPTGSGGPCGPTTEIYVDGVEVWNIVFNEFLANVSRDELLRGGGTLTPLKLSGVDTGMGLERLISVLNGQSSVFETDLLHPILTEIAALAPGLEPRELRILTDHLRAAIFLIGDGVEPSNKEAGYILRRLLRRIQAIQISRDIHADIFPYAVRKVREIFGEIYREINDEERILHILESEKQKFEKAVAKGLSELRKLTAIDAKEAFHLYETYGLPFELIKEFSPKEALTLSREEFERELERHKEVSRAGAEKKFGGHGLILNTGELKAANYEELKKVTRLHTATHLLQQALRDVLGPEVEQRGSDITAERTRFDFKFHRKLAKEELLKVEEIVNEKIAADLPVQFVELPKAEAEKTGALYFFKEKYPERVKVYFVGESLPTAWSKEFCGGPHVARTSEIGKFKILKEEAVASGVRRIRATVD
jgi:alanyl-tRNA synthetase